MKMFFAQCFQGLVKIRDNLSRIFRDKGEPSPPISLTIAAANRGSAEPDADYWKACVV